MRVGADIPGVKDALDKIKPGALPDEMRWAFADGIAAMARYLVGKTLRVAMADPYMTPSILDDRLQTLVTEQLYSINDTLGALPGSGSLIRLCHTATIAAAEDEYGTLGPTIRCFVARSHASTSNMPRPQSARWCGARSACASATCDTQSSESWRQSRVQPKSESRPAIVQIRIAWL